MAMTPGQVEVYFQSSYGRSATAEEQAYWQKKTQAEIAAKIGADKLNRYVYDSAKKQWVPKGSETKATPEQQTAYTNDPNHLGDALKQQTMASQGYTWEWTNQAKNEGHYVQKAATTSGGSTQTAPDGSTAAPTAVPGIETVKFTIPGTNTVVDMPKSVFDDPTFKQLTPDNQGIVAYQWSIVASQNTATAARFTKALELAIKQAGPMQAEALAIAKRSIDQTIGTGNLDPNAKEESLMADRARIEKSLTENKAYLTAEEQAALAQQKDLYDQELEGLRENMASSGLTFSTISARAQERAAKQYEGVVGSVQRSYGKQLSDVQSNANELLAKNEGNIRSAVQSFEQIYGTEAAKGFFTGQEFADLGGMDLSKYLIGNLTGSAAATNAQDVATRFKGLLGSLE